MSTAGAGEGEKEEEEVVMRRPRNVFEPSERQKELDNSSGGCEGKKRVKWSESTDLREKLKVYRRSQLDIPLNYQHIALEEAREKAGVKRWRDSLQKGAPLEFADDKRPSIDMLNIRISTGATPGDNGGDDEDDDEEEVRDDGGDGDSDSCDEELEKKLLIIKSKTTKHTILPAYAAAVTVYKEWLSSSKNTNGLPDETVSCMKRQLKMYQEVVKVYKAWGDQADDKSGHFDLISSLLQEAADLGAPPQHVSKTISQELADAENVKRQVNAYNSMVQDMITAREEAAGKN